MSTNTNTNTTSSSNTKNNDDDFLTTTVVVTTAATIVPMEDEEFDSDEEYDSDEEEEEPITLFIFESYPSPQQLAYEIVNKFPNTTELKFGGQMGDYGNNNLSILLKALIIDGVPVVEDVAVADHDDDESSSSTKNIIKKLDKINKIDFSDLEFHDIGWIIRGNDDDNKNELMECLKIVGSSLLPNNTLKEIRIPGYRTGTPSDTVFPTRKPNGPPSSTIVELLRHHKDTLAHLELNYPSTCGDDMIEAIIDLLKNDENNNTTLLYFNSYDLDPHLFHNKPNPQTIVILRYYLALNNIGRKEWGKNLVADRSLCIDTLSNKIPKPEEFDTYDDDDDDDDDRTGTTTTTTTTTAKKKKKNPTYLTYCMKNLSEEKKELWYTSFVYDFLHCNLDLYESHH